MTAYSGSKATTQAPDDVEAGYFGSSVYGGRPNFALARREDAGGATLALYELLPDEQAAARRERLERAGRTLSVEPFASVFGDSSVVETELPVEGRQEPLDQACRRAALGACGIPADRSPMGRRGWPGFAESHRHGAAEPTPVEGHRPAAILQGARLGEPGGSIREPLDEVRRVAAQRQEHAHLRHGGPLVRGWNVATNGAW